MIDIETLRNMEKRKAFPRKKLLILLFYQ